MRKGLLVIIGELGTGKATFSEKPCMLFARKSKQLSYRMALVAGNDLLRPIITDFALRTLRKPSAMIKRLNDHLLEQFEQENIVALMIDEAQKILAKQSKS
jgi:type II secretory pathway predicted ATPase ExeA